MEEREARRGLDDAFRETLLAITNKVDEGGLDGRSMGLAKRLDLTDEIASGLGVAMGGSNPQQLPGEENAPNRWINPGLRAAHPRA